MRWAELDYERMDARMTDAHECFFRGCKEVVVGRYHCERHEAILERQRAAQAQRNSEKARRARTVQTPVQTSTEEKHD
jgi:hypothetical protein